MRGGGGGEGGAGGLAGTAALRVNESCFTHRDLLARGPLHALRQLGETETEDERLDKVARG